MSALLIALAVVAGIQPGLVMGQDPDFLQRLDRFDLYNACRPMLVLIGTLNDDANAIGLTKNRLRAAAESRLRAASLYVDFSSEGAVIAKTNGSNLGVFVQVVGAAFSVRLEYRKLLSDPATGETLNATTWNSGTFGTHGRDSGDIVRSLAEQLDKFLAEYLRVSEKDCPR